MNPILVREVRCRYVCDLILIKNKIHKGNSAFNKTVTAAFTPKCKLKIFHIFFIIDWYILIKTVFSPKELSVNICEANSTLIHADVSLETQKRCSV